MQRNFVGKEGKEAITCVVGCGGGGMGGGEARVFLEEELSEPPPKLYL